MGKTYTDFSQLSKGMIRKSATVEEIKPLPRTKAGGGDDVLSFFGLNAPDAPTVALGDRSGNGRILALEADVRAVRAESAALEAAKAEAERKAGDLERQLAAERQMQAWRTGVSPVQGEDTFTWSYLTGSDLKSSLSYPNGLTASWTYDANNQLLQVSNATPPNIISQYDYMYDAASRRINVSKKLGDRPCDCAGNLHNIRLLFENNATFQNGHFGDRHFGDRPQISPKGWLCGAKRLGGALAKPFC